MANLSKQAAVALSSATVVLPEPAHFALPEKVLQFGTGVLLRGLPDYLIDKANRQGVFNGRIVVVKSTDGGDATAFDRQDGLYTLSIRGVEDGRTIEKNVVCSAISRVLSAKSQWEQVLDVARNPELTVVISNTTEVGIQLVSESIKQSPPQSFPGKLLAVLYARYQAFNGAADKGLVIVPTELIPNNGAKLESIVLELAHLNGLEAEFIEWLESANSFCNSLVDRIVPGRPDAATQAALEAELGYSDDLLTMSEAYLLWAIEGDAHVKSVLAFEQVDAGVIVQPNIDLFRELKLRLLNGTHTLSCGLAHLAGFDTVRSAMDDAAMAGFIQNLMLADLLPGIPYSVDEKVGQRFGMQVLDRFRIPYIEHRWLGITLNYTMKIQMRNVPTLLHYYKKLAVVPDYMALGFAAYLLFMRGTQQHEDVWYGEANGQAYPIQDEKAGYFADLWQRQQPAELIGTVLRNKTLWGHDLAQLPGFAARVEKYLHKLLQDGAAATLASYFTQKVSLAS